MSDKIRVRLVPKTSSNIPISETFGTKTSLKSKDFKPDLNKAEEALRRVLNSGMQANLTKNNSISAEVERSKIKSMFKANLKSKGNKTLGRAFTLHESSLTTQKELILPEEISELVEFAYIPTSPEFFAPSFIAPKISHYYLDLTDVLRTVNGARCHRMGWTGQNVRVAMTDTGFARHPFFDSNGYHIERIATETTSSPQIDPSGHGSSVSANTLIVAPDCQFIGVKHDDYSALALETALESNPRIITNSWGWNIDKMDKTALRNNDINTYYELIDLENIILDAINDGVSVVFAAGNGHRAFPGCIPEVISVGGVSVDINGNMEASSYASSFVSQLYPNRKVPDFCGIVGEYGNSPLKGHIMLPVPNNCELEGENMPNNKQNLGWGIFSGTSAAAPQVAGVIALMLSVNPELNPAQIKRILSDTSIDITSGTTFLGDTATQGRDNATGSGFINAFDACLMASNIKN